MSQPCLLHTNPDVYLLEVPLAQAIASSTNCYLVKDGADSLIIDPGAPQQASLDALVSQLDALEVDRSHASFALTHFHLDHAGLLDRIAPPDATVYASATDLERARPEQLAARAHELAQRLLAEGVAEEDASACLRTHARSVGFNLDAHPLRAVREGDAIPVGRFALNVLELPGHTVGHLAFYERTSRTLFCGDCVLKLISPCLAGPVDNWDTLQAYFDSLERMRAMPVETLAWGHGGLRPDFQDRIRWLADHHRRRAAETLAIVAERPGLTGSEIVRSLRWSVPFDSWEDIPPLQKSTILAGGLAVVDHLVVHGAVERHRAPDGTNRYRAVVGEHRTFPPMAAQPRIPSVPTNGVWYDDPEIPADGCEDDASCCVNS